MGIPMAIKVIKNEYEKENEAKAWGLYKSIYPLMCKKEIEYIAFENFYKKEIDKVTDKSNHQILEEINQIRAKQGGESHRNI